jgi:hypothetical protein
MALIILNWNGQSEIEITLVKSKKKFTNFGKCEKKCGLTEKVIFC